MTDLDVPPTGGRDPSPLRATPGTLTIVLTPVPSRPGRYAAALGSEELCRSRQPLYDSARVLLARGVPPGTVIEARHAGSAIIGMRSTLGDAAQWSVEETDRDGLRRVRWTPARHAPRRSGYASPLAGEPVPGISPVPTPATLPLRAAA